MIVSISLRPPGNLKENQKSHFPLSRMIMISSNCNQTSPAIMERKFSMSPAEYLLSTL